MNVMRVVLLLISSKKEHTARDVMLRCADSSPKLWTVGLE